MVEPRWLRLAKGLGIGSKRRYICCGKDAAGIVANDPTKWWAYCHRCHKSHSMNKQFVKQVQVQAERNMQPVPADQISIRNLSEDLRSEIANFLLSKSIWFPDMVDGDRLFYSKSVNRLIFELSTNYMGRSLSDYPPRPKWIEYIKQGVKPQQYELMWHVLSKKIILVEDYLSALKLKYCMEKEFYLSYPIEIMYCYGTRFSSSMMAHISANDYREVYVFFDGDKGGYDGCKTIFERMKWDNNVEVKSLIVNGKDPKDLTVHELCTIIAEKVGI